MLTEIILFILTAFLLAFFLHRKPKGLPPGEWGLPVVGYVPFVSWKLTNTLKKLEKKHGKIYSLKLGVHTFIVIADYPLIKEAYNKIELTGRPPIFGYNLIVEFGELGLVLSEGHMWTTNRRFALKALRDFGLGKSKLEEFIITESEHLVKGLKNTVDKPFKVDWSLNVAVLNVIWGLVANRRFDINDPKILEFSKNSTESLEQIEGPVAILDIFPWLLPFLPKFVKNSWMKMDLIVEKRDKLYAFLKEVLEEHKKTLDRNDPRDYIDKYLIEYDIQKDKPEYAHWCDADLLVSVYELFIAGSDTTSSTMRWFFLYMAKYPQIQKRIQQEIDQVLPRDRLPVVQDRDRLPLLQALTYEVARVVSLLPTSIVHQALEDTTLAGYLIPKGSLVVPNIESIHSDPKYWKHPNEFSLENFLDENGKFVPNEAFMSFSIGRRQCLGENLARMELFMFMGAVLQNFDILEPDGQPISLIPDQAVNVFNFPGKHDILLKNRA